jgi:thymidylate synthase (FAD)
LNVELIALTQCLIGNGTPDALIERSGRVCYGSVGHGDPETFIRKRMEAGHESIIEHASATFEISGISRACAQQITRHRIASYSMRSQRFADTDGVSIVVPDSIKDHSEGALDLFVGQCVDAHLTYRKLRKMGIPKEDARFVFPNAVHTHLIVTMNFRSWLNFLRLRLAKDAQWEIRQVAEQVLEQLSEVSSVFTAVQQSI